MREQLLAPNFEQVPTVLATTPRWVAWRFENTKKVPYWPHSPFPRASATDDRTWSDFDAAADAYATGAFSGVGIVLNGDGLVGVDLDDCVVGGKPSPDAQVVLDQIGCEYVEFSPSGTGLRAFGYAEGASAAVGKLGTVKIELYASKRYLTVTGHTIRSGQIRPLPGWNSIWQAIKTPRNTEEREALESRSSVTSGSSVFIETFPVESIPKTAGQRNRCVFQLARHLKARNPGADVNDMLSAVQQWHHTFVDVIDTKVFSVTWADFCYAWSRVRFKVGDQVLESLLANVPAPPAHLVRAGYDEVMQRLVGICLRLQEHEGAAPFFLGCRKAGELLGVHFTHAGSLLRLLVADGILRVVDKGSNGRSTRYRVNSPIE